MRVGYTGKCCPHRRITARVLSVVLVDLADIYSPCLKLHAQFAKSGKGQLLRVVFFGSAGSGGTFLLQFLPPTHEEPTGTHLHLLAVSLSPPNRQASTGESGQRCPCRQCPSGSGGRMAEPWAAVSVGRVGGMDGDGGGPSVDGAVSAAWPPPALWL